jgi:spore coat polysaccharide biosynthesis protein SpsF
VNVLLVVQARMGSTRLPGKVLRPLAGAPLLERMLERLAAAKTPTECVVATTTEESDDPLRQLCRRLSVKCFSGHPSDLLDRHYRAAVREGADVVVKIPSDCPLIDPEVIDRVVGFYLDRSAEYDFVSNLHPATYPDGNDVEVVPFEVLETAFREARKPWEREHTTPFVWDQPERFRVGNVTWEAGLDLSMSHRFTVDYSEDLAFADAVFSALWNRQRPVFDLRDILTYLAGHPEVVALNAPYAGVNWYRDHLPDLRTVGPGNTRELEGKP